MTGYLYILWSVFEIVLYFTVVPGFNPQAGVPRLVTLDTKLPS